MLEAFNNLREDFQKSLQKQREVDQTSDWLFFFEYLTRAFTRVCFIAFKTCHLTKLVKTSLAQQNAIIFATHLTLVISVLPAERQVRATIHVSLCLLPGPFALHLLKNNYPKSPSGSVILKNLTRKTKQKT